jgi:hypothetical protein
MTRNLKTVAAFAADPNRPFSEAQCRWWIFNERLNGMTDHGVVVRIGRRVYIDSVAFDKWVDSQQEVREVAA